MRAARTEQKERVEQTAVKWHNYCSARASPPADSESTLAAEEQGGAKGRRGEGTKRDAEEEEQRKNISERERAGSHA